MSVEIRQSFAPVVTTITGLNQAEKQVLACLRANSLIIANAERRFRVDRRAIAGAIAWEMLQNVKTKLTQAVGYGKVHVFNANAAGVGRLLKQLGRFEFKDIDSAAKEVEERGYLKKRSFSEREALLQTPEGAIQYIAAIMGAEADIAVTAGFKDIRNNPVILTNVYQGKTLDEWEDHLKKKQPGSSFEGGNTMDIWVGTYLWFLEDGVGKPEIPKADLTSFAAHSSAQQ